MNANQIKKNLDSLPKILHKPNAEGIHTITTHSNHYHQKQKNHYHQKQKLVLTLTTTMLTHVRKTRNRLQFDDTHTRNSHNY